VPAPGGSGGGHREGLELTLRDLATGQQQTHRYDAVILATGYERRSHRDLLAPLAGYLEDFSVDRNYRVLASPDLQASVYLQGFCENSHGLSDTLLSVLPAALRKLAERCTRTWRSCTASRKPPWP
jgi:L-ornithine N5-oxygenase